MASGVKVVDIELGTGAVVNKGSTVSIRWRGTLNRGDEFGSGALTFRVGERRVIAGLEKGVVGMRVGGIRRLRVSPHVAYGDKSVPGVPPNAVLNFEVEVLESRRTSGDLQDPSGPNSPP